MIWIKNKHKRICTLIIATCCLMTTLSGCNKETDPLSSLSKDELIAKVNSIQAELDGSYTLIEELQDKMKGIIDTEEDTAGITEFSDNSGRLTLQSVDDKVTLPQPFEYPASTQTYNASTISLTDSVYIKPSANWVVRLSGTQIDFYHSESDISGIIKIGQRDMTQKTPLVEEITNTILTFFESMPQTTVRTSKIYLEQNWLGTDASASTFIDEAEAEIRCGMVGISNTNITYMFVYGGQQDYGKDELIVTLLQTMNVYGQQFRIE